MASLAPVDLLPIYGPHVLPDRPAATLEESLLYCRQLAQQHYENFVVASWLLPRELRPHFYAVYAYCRWADDLADEAGSPEECLRLLDWWHHELQECYRGRVRHPVFVALYETVTEFEIPISPFADLLDAFRQDQLVRRYATFDKLLDYCSRSANPVGRIVLHLGRCYDHARGRLSDSICTGLQLANFWQDVARDWDKGRVYLPSETLQRFRCDDQPWVARRATDEFRAALRFEVDRAEMFLRAGLPLVGAVPRALRGDVWLFAQGGLRILQHIRRQQFDVWSVRPRVTKAEQLRLLVGCVWRNLTGFGGGAR